MKIWGDEPITKSNSDYTLGVECKVCGTELNVINQSNNGRIYKQYGDEQWNERGMDNKEKFYDLLPWTKKVIEIENESEFNSQKLECSQRKDYDFEM